MTVYQDEMKNGRKRWRVDVTWEHPDGRVERVRKVSPVQTKRGAEQYERDLRASLAGGTYGKPKVEAMLTLGGFQDRYFRDHVAKNKPASRSSADSIWRNWLLPEFEDTPLDQLDEGAFASLTGTMLARGSKPKTINNTMSQLLTVLTCAKDWKIIHVVPKVKWLKPGEIGFDFFNYEEADKLVALGHPMVTTAIRTGMRIGELLALRWDCVAFDRNAIDVERSVFFEDGEVYEGTTKGNRNRSLKMTPSVREALESLKRTTRTKEFVFANAAGGQMTRNMAKWVLWGAQRAAGIRKTGWHVCRHTFASHLVMRGTDLPTVQRLMGHSTIAMTMKYSHLAPGHLRNAVDVLEAPIGIKPDSTASRDHVATTKPAEV